MSLPDLPRHQVRAFHTRAILATAALANWPLDVTGRAQRQAVNDSLRPGMDHRAGGDLTDPFHVSEVANA